MSDRRSQIAQRVQSGRDVAAIARELGLAPATVRYHLRRLDLTPGADAAVAPANGVIDERGGAPAQPAGESTVIATREQVRVLLEAGASRAEIARRLGVGRATVSYHARRLSAPIDERCARRYDWFLIQQFYDEGHTVRQCIDRFGFSSASWFQAVRRGAITPRPTALSMAELCIDGRARGRFHLKARLLREGLKTNRCGTCGIENWQGRPLTLALHHVNGVRTDNRLANLQLLCPNCHSQTDNFAGRRRSTEEEARMAEAM